MKLVLPFLQVAAQAIIRGQLLQVNGCPAETVTQYREFLFQVWGEKVDSGGSDIFVGPVVSWLLLFQVSLCPLLDLVYDLYAFLTVYPKIRATKFPAVLCLFSASL